MAYSQYTQSTLSLHINKATGISHRANTIFPSLYIGEPSKTSGQVLDFDTVLAFTEMPIVTILAVFFFFIMTKGDNDKRGHDVRHPECRLPTNISAKA